MSHLRSTLPTVALLALVVLVRSASALTVLPVDLPTMTADAARIFVGRVERVASGRDGNGLPATWTTFTVEEPVKGPAERTVTLKQLGTSLGTDAAAVLPHPALPRYRVGESVVLFVQPESTLGFTSPVGLGQGCFRVRTEAEGRVVANDVANRNLAPPAASPRRAVAGAPPTARPLEAFLSEVRALVAADR